MLPHHSKLSKTSNNADDEANTEDLVSNLPHNLTDKILQLLPLSEAAKLGVLSKTWHNNWSCITSLRFDYNFGVKFRKKRKLDWERFSSVINNILLLHQGPLPEFLPYIPKSRTTNDDKEMTLNLRRWIFFVSRNGVKKITLCNSYVLRVLSMPSHIFICKDLEELILHNFFLVPPPTGFMGFVHLSKLELISIQFKLDMLRSLIESCPELASLDIRQYKPLKGLVIDAPKLEKLCLCGAFGILDVNNVPKLAQLQLQLTGLGLTSLNVKLVTIIKNLATSCPSIKTLNISVDASNDVVVQRNFDYDNDFKLGYLCEVNFKRVQGSFKELKLIEYLLSVSNVLEKLLLQFAKIDDSLQLKVQKQLNGFQRASPKAIIIFVE
ncbi:hypothetical protein RDABS01_005931 [Bienertia sinuspersici]